MPSLEPISCLLLYTFDEVKALRNTVDCGLARSGSKGEGLIVGPSTAYPVAGLSHIDIDALVKLDELSGVNKHV